MANLPVWNRCFICASPHVKLPSSTEEANEDADKGRKLITAKRICFLKYLLGSSSAKHGSVDNATLHQEVMELVSSSLESDSGQMKICKKCDVRAEKISAMHLELEMLQMKILDMIQLVKSICRWVDENEGFEEDLRKFEKSVLQQQLQQGNDGSTEFENMSRFVRILTEVHNTLSQKEMKQTIFTPYCSPVVVLEKCDSFAKNESIWDLTKCSVKQEPQDVNNDDLDDNDNHFEDLHQDDYNDENELFTVPSTELVDDIRTKPSRKRKRKRRHGSLTRSAKAAKRSKLITQKLRRRRNSSLESTHFPVQDTDVKEEHATTDLYDNNNSFSQSTLSIPSKNLRKNNKKLSVDNNTKKKNMNVGPTLAEKLLLKLKAEHIEIFALHKISTDLTCGMCGYKTGRGCTLDQHLRSHEVESKTFTCPEITCGRNFSSLQFFIFHLQQHCTRKRRCTSCEECLPVLQMEEHLKTHFERLYPCEFCDFSFGSFVELVNHIRHHPNVSPKCQLCNEPEFVSKQYSGQAELRHHLYEDHKMEEILIKCNYSGCGKTFSTLSLKEKHVNSTHTTKQTKSKPKPSFAKIISQEMNASEDGRSATEQLLLTMKADVSNENIFHAMGSEHFNCVTCDFKTQVAVKMDQHLRSHETEEKEFHCPDSTCQRSFTNKQHFVFHLQQHCSRIRKCLSCDEKLPVLQMEEHLKTHFNKLFPCESCDFSFGSFPDLVQHNRFHPHVNLKCQLCANSKLSNRLYKRRVELRKHLYKHHNMDEVLLKCSYPGCSEAFFDLHQKLAHANVHKKEYMCEICSEGFPNYSRLYLHIKTFHKTEKNLLKTIKAVVEQRHKAKKPTRTRPTERKRSEAEKMLHKIEAEESSKELFFSLKQGRFVCVICGFKAQKSWIIDQHFREHESEKKFHYCPEESCGRSFTCKQAFVFHLQNHYRRKQKCEDCTMLLPILDMKEHAKTHHEQVFTCQLCDFSYGNFKDLLNHGRYHSKADLICQLCTEPETTSQQYPTRQLLLEHLFSYHKMDDLLLKCDYAGCTETFLDPLPKKIHFEKVHNKLTRNSTIRRRARKEKIESEKFTNKEDIFESTTNIVPTTQCSETEKLLLKLEAEESSYEVIKALKSESFGCVTCTFRSSRAYVMEQHFRDHEKEMSEKIFHCPQIDCNKSFALKQAFIFHLQQHCTRQRKCEECSEYVPVLCMKDHLKIHYDQIYCCQICDYCFGNFKDFAVHVRYHYNTDLKCELCDDPEMASQVYHGYSRLFQHFYEYHEIEEVAMKCKHPDCNEKFFGVKQKTDHEFKHQQRYKCNICGKLFASLSKLSSHREIHTQENNCLCDQCPKRFKTKAVLEAHKIKMHGMQPYTCELCVDIKKEFKTRSGLELHIASYHKKISWQCSICGKQLSKKATWIAHEQTHSTDKNFHCKKCPYATNALYSLKRHEKLHGEKKWVCDICSKAFVIKRYLDEHMLTHTQEKPFVCDLCGSRFNQRYSLSFHKKNKHGFIKGNCS